MGRYADSGLVHGARKGSQKSLEQEVYEAAAKARARDAAPESEEEALIDELKSNGAKFTREDIVFILKDNTGMILWLEKGNERAGLDHIRQRHGQDFKSKYNVNEQSIPEFIERVIRDGVLLRSDASIRANRKAIERIYKYQGVDYLLLALGDNGFIVSAYPIKPSKG